MGKDYTLETTHNLHGKIKFNYIELDEDDIQTYYIMRIEFETTAKDNGISKKGEEGINIGNAQFNKFTNNEIYNKITNILGQSIAMKLKNLFLNLTNEDISQE